jgi:hypothetical protein
MTMRDVITVILFVVLGIFVMTLIPHCALS